MPISLTSPYALVGRHPNVQSGEVTLRIFKHGRGRKYVMLASRITVLHKI
jgi:hypothetical protein